jgi:hypothetical protein
MIKSVGNVPPLTPGATGYVYVVGFGSYIKIGWTRNPQQRLFEVQDGAPVRLTVYLIRPAIKSHEAELHDRFANQRLRGEWFDYEGALRDWIRARCPL